MNTFTKLRKGLVNFANFSFITLIGMLTGVILILLSLYQYPDYNIYQHFVSALGASPGVSGPLFNSGLIIIGLSASYFFYNLGKHLKEENIRNKLRVTTIRIAVFSSISLIFVGIFPSLGTIIKILHGISAFSFFFSSMIYFTLLGYLMLKHKKFTRFQSYTAFGVAFMAGTLFFDWAPLLEWSFFWASISWMFYNAFLLFIKRVKNIMPIN